MDNKKHSILIVDDEVNLLESFGDLMEEEGYRVTKAISGFAALKELKENTFDLIFVDLKMPGMDGIELIEKIRAQDPVVPIIVLTGSPKLESAIEAINNDVNAFLLKPYDLVEIKLAIYHALEKATLVKQNNELIKELKKANEELRAAKDQLAAQIESSSTEKKHLECILDSLPLAIIWITPADEVGYINSRAEALLKSPREKLAGLKVSSLFDGAFHEFYKGVKENISHASTRIELPEQITLIASAVPVLDSHARRGGFIIILENNLQTGI